MLDIGAGSGYSLGGAGPIGGDAWWRSKATARLAARARELLPSVGCTTVSVVEGDLSQGWESEGPYDAIVIEGAIEVVPDALFDQLKDGGRLVAISGRGAGRATVWQREGRSFGAAEVFDATGDVLPGFEKPPAFAF